jgi:citrate synthase
MLTQSSLKENLHYNKTTGCFTRLSNGKIAGCLDKDGYVIIKINKKNMKAHRLAWLYVHGEFPEEQIDHINRDRSDNRIENLRCVSAQENSYNKSKYSNSGYCVGVTWSGTSNKWHSRISVDKKEIHLGYFELYSDALNARKNAEALYRV